MVLEAVLYLIGHRDLVDPHIDTTKGLLDCRLSSCLVPRAISNWEHTPTGTHLTPLITRSLGFAETLGTMSPLVQWFGFTVR